MAAVLVLNTPDDGRLRPKHVEWLCRNKTCTVLHQVGVSFDLAWLGFNRRGRIITRVFRDRNYELQRYWLFPILAEILSILAQNYIFSLKIMLVHFWAVPPGGGHNSRSPPPPLALSQLHLCFQEAGLLYRWFLIWQWLRRYIKSHLVHYYGRTGRWSLRKLKGICSCC